MAGRPRGADRPPEESVKILGTAAGLVEKELQGELAEPSAARLYDPARRDELERAWPCVLRFLELELDPAAGGAVGGEGKRALGELLRDPEEPEVHQYSEILLWFGYMAALVPELGEVSFKPEREPRELWGYWIDHLRSAAAYALPSQFIALLRVRGADYLSAEFERLGQLPGRSKEQQLTERAGAMPIFGAILRLAQTSSVSDQDFSSDRGQNLDRWPFHATD